MANNIVQDEKVDNIPYKPKELQQLCIDLGSSQYLLAVKLRESEMITMDVMGEQHTTKIDSTACVSLQKCINKENVEPQYVDFGIQDSKEKANENLVIFQNWKIWFYESEVKIEYPFSPSIPSSGDRSARVWISSLFEAFMFKALCAFFPRIEQNDNEKQFIHLVTFLVPSIINSIHKEFLGTCFSQALKQFASQRKKYDKNLSKSHIVYFQTKDEAVACLQTALIKIYGNNATEKDENRKFKRLQQQSFVIADLGGFTSDFAQATLNNNQFSVKCDALNIAGNSIDEIRKTLIINQFGDLQITNQYCLQQLLMNVKNNNLDKIEVKQNNTFINPVQLCVYMVQMIIECISKIKTSSVIDEVNLNALLKIFLPYVNDNMNENAAQKFILNNDSDKLQQLKQIIINNERTTIASAQQNQIIFWIFSNLKSECLEGVLHFLIESNKEQYKRQAFLQLKCTINEHLCAETKLLQQNLKQKGLSGTQLKTLKIYINLIEILPHITSFDYFKIAVNKELLLQNIDEKDKEMNEVINNMYQKLQQGKLDSFDLEIISNINLVNAFLNQENQDFNISKNILLQRTQNIKAKTLKPHLMKLIQNTETNGSMFQKFSEIICQYVDCKYLKQTIGNMVFKNYDNCHLIHSIYVSSEKIILNLTEQCLLSTRKIVIAKIQQIILEKYPNTNIIYSGGFAQCDEFNNDLKIIPHQLVIGGIENENCNFKIMKQNAMDDEVVQINKFKFEFTEELQLSQSEPNTFFNNKINIDIGTSGTQAYFAWAKQDYQSTIDAQQDVFKEYVRKRLEQENTSEKMPSFAIINYTKLEQTAKDFSSQYFINGVATELFQDIFIHETFSPAQFADCISFESIINSKKMQLNTPKVGKLIKKNGISCNIDIIKSWKRKLFDIEQPNYPEYPTYELDYGDDQEAKYKIKIPVSIIYVSMLLFVKSKYQLFYEDAPKLHSSLSVSLTVPCGANQHHLQFLRCCCKSAGFGDNISFIFEPMSAFCHLMYSNIYKNYVKIQESDKTTNNTFEIVKQKADKVIKERVEKQNGVYLVIDIGGGTTDVALIEVSTQNKGNYAIPVTKLSHYFSLLEAGDYIDNTFFELINFTQIKKCLTSEQELELQTTLTTFKQQLSIKYITENIEECLFEIKLDDTVQKNKSSQLQKIQVMFEQNKFQLKNVQWVKIEEKKLKFSVLFSKLANVMYECSEKILLGIKKYLQHLCINLQEEWNGKQIIIQCVGGVSGNQIFQSLVTNILQCNQQKIQSIDAKDAQTSIARGGLYLTQEKDHINFGVRQTKTYNENISSIHLKDIDIALQVCDKSPTLQNSTQTFYSSRIQQLTERYFTCSSGWYGVSVAIYAKKGQNSIKIGIINFSVEQLQNLNSSDSINELNQAQFIYVGCIFVKVNNVSLNISCKLMKKESKYENNSEHQFIESGINVQLPIFK